MFSGKESTNCVVTANTGPQVPVRLPAGGLRGEGESGDQDVELRRDWDGSQHPQH